MVLTFTLCIVATTALCKPVPIMLLIYLLFLPEFPITFTHYSYFILMPSPIIPVIFFNFYCVSDNKVHSLFSS